MFRENIEWICFMVCSHMVVQQFFRREHFPTQVTLGWFDLRTDRILLCELALFDFDTTCFKSTTEFQSVRFARVLEIVDIWRWFLFNRMGFASSLQILRVLQIYNILHFRWTYSPLCLFLLVVKMQFQFLLTGEQQAAGSTFQRVDFATQEDAQLCVSTVKLCESKITSKLSRHS